MITVGHATVCVLKMQWLKMRRVLFKYSQSKIKSKPSWFLDFMQQLP
jgi:hypothetical protein